MLVLSEKDSPFPVDIIAGILVKFYVVHDGVIRAAEWWRVGKEFDIFWLWFKKGVCVEGVLLEETAFVVSLVDK